VVAGARAGVVWGVRSVVRSAGRLADVQAGGVVVEAVGEVGREDEGEGRVMVTGSKRRAFALRRSCENPDGHGVNAELGRVLRGYMRPAESGQPSWSQIKLSRAVGGAVTPGGAL